LDALEISSSHQLKQFDYFKLQESATRPASQGMSSYIRSRFSGKKIPTCIPFNANEVNVHFLLGSAARRLEVQIRLLENRSPAYPNRSFFGQHDRQAALCPRACAALPDRLKPAELQG
jgi:hypothetical protein